MSREGRSRRWVLKAAGCLGTVGLAGCSDGGDEDDFDPELAAVVVENLDETPHTVTIELYRGTPLKESVVNRTREMGVPASAEIGSGSTGAGPTEWRISDFPGMATDFTLKIRVDDGDQHTFQTSINGCTRFRVEIQDAETVNLSEEGKTICYQG